nr:cation transporter [uncultured Anaeromusa sp.]
MQTKVFGVEGMSCGHCQQAVETAALSVTGVQTAAVQLAAKTVTVTYDEEKFQLPELIAAIEDAGFEVGQS